MAPRKPTPQELRGTPCSAGTIASPPLCATGSPEPALTPPPSQQKQQQRRDQGRTSPFSLPRGRVNRGSPAECPSLPSLAW